MADSKHQNAQLNQPLLQIGELLTSSKTRLDSILEPCSELDFAAEVIVLLTPMLETNEQAKLCPLIESLKVQAGDLEEARVIFSETLHKVSRAYIEINMSRIRNVLAPVDPKTGVAL